MPGIGVGARFAPFLAPATVAVPGAGLALHAWEMYDDRHRLERGAVRYATALYRLCRGPLARVAGYLPLRAPG